MTPPFRPRFPWWGGDLQTLRNRFAYRHRPLPGVAEDFQISLEDGDTLTGTLHWSDAPEAEPLIFLLHGLTGSEDSMYMLESTRYHLQRGRSVLRMNLRGAGSSEPLCKTPYAGTSWPDILSVLDALDSGGTEHGVFIVGYSMGGNILLNGLPHFPDETICIGAAAVSAPIDPAGASRRLMEKRNRVYENALLTEMQDSHLLLPLADDPNMKRAIENAGSIWDFDDKVTAPRLGFNSALDYYTATAGKDRIAATRVPLLLIHAEDDPWIPVTPYRALSPAPMVTLDITESGGHVGFHGTHCAQPWHDLRVSDFIDGLTGRSTPGGVPSP